MNTLQKANCPLSWKDSIISHCSYISLALQEAIRPQSALQTTGVRGDTRAMLWAAKLAHLVGTERSQDAPGWQGLSNPFSRRLLCMKPQEETHPQEQHYSFPPALGP